MAYKNSFCKTGKPKSGLRMDRSPLSAHPMNDRGGVLNYGTSMMKVNAGICPSCRKNKTSCSKKACPGDGLPKKSCSKR